jgi:hypothetical protein
LRIAKASFRDVEIMGQVDVEPGASKQAGLLAKRKICRLGSACPWKEYYRTPRFYSARRSVLVDHELCIAAPKLRSADRFFGGEEKAEKDYSA